MNITPILDTVLDGRIKGIPGTVRPFPLREVPAKGWNVLREDLPFPLLVLKETELSNNLNGFQKYLGDHGISFAPHGKTTMCPQLFERQLNAGAWGITAATVNQMQVYRSFGVNRILFANELFGPQHIAYVVQELNRDPDFELFCLVDSVELIERTSHVARQAGLKRPLNVLLEGGAAGGRTGCRTMDEALAVLAAIQKNRDVLCLAGIEGYEGVIGGNPDEQLAKIDRFLMFLHELLEYVDAKKLASVDELLLTAGGSSFFDRVVSLYQNVKLSTASRVVVRSGCYIAHDSLVYEQRQAQAVKRGWCGLLKPALEIWSYVQAIPEPSLVVLSMGKRDCPYDRGNPVPEKLFRPGEGWQPLPAKSEIFSLNDQHALLRYEGANPFQVGDLLACGISHPCSAFDRWKFIPAVNEQYDVVEGLLTFF